MSVILDKANALATAIHNYGDTVDKLRGKAGGITPLDNNTQVPPQYLPSLAPAGSPVAFSVTAYPYVSSPGTPKLLAPGQTYLIGRSTDFNNTVVDTNSNSAFDSTTGRFTAPCSGLFHFSAFAARTGGNTELQFYKNGSPIGQPALSYSNNTSPSTVTGAQGDYLDWETAHLSTVLSLVAGDYITAVVMSVNNTQSDMYSLGFSGHLLSAGQGPQGIQGQTGPVGPQGPSTYDLQNFINGKPLAQEVLMRTIACRAFTIKAGCPNSYAFCSVGATVDFPISIMKNGVEVGTIDFAPNATSGTFTLATDLTLNPGDTFTLQCKPTAQDSTLSDLTISLKADTI